jgi:hypothetical protein
VAEAYWISQSGSILRVQGSNKLGLAFGTLPSPRPYLLLLAKRAPRDNTHIAHVASERFRGLVSGRYIFLPVVREAASI